MYKLSIAYQLEFKVGLPYFICSDLRRRVPLRSGMLGSTVGLNANESMLIGTW